jgi:hypothetical protein
MVDPIAALVAWLNLDGTLVALVDGRTYGGELPREQVAAMPRAAVVLRPAGGGLLGRAYQDVGDVRVDVECYGAVARQAWEVNLAVYQALKHLSRVVSAGVLLHWAQPSSKGVLARDPVTDWPVCLASYQVLAAEVPAA